MVSTSAFADDGAGRIAFCAVTTPVRIVARLFGSAESQYCTPWKKEELAAKKAAKAHVADATRTDEAPKPVVVATQTAQ